MKNAKYGFVDRDGKEAVALKYDSASDFENGFARVNRNGKDFYIGKDGTEFYIPK